MGMRAGGFHTIIILISCGICFGLFAKFIIHKVNSGIAGSTKTQVWLPIFLMVVVVLIARMG